MTDDELDAAEEAGDLNSSNAPLGPDEELMEDDDSSLFGPNNLPLLDDLPVIWLASRLCFLMAFVICATTACGF
jgi:hypothetical protein